MKYLWMLFTVVLALPLSAASVGDEIDDFCGKNASGEEICLDDYDGDIRVIIFNAGWCEPCKSHMLDLAPKVKKYKDDDVTFMSFSIAGWSTTSKPTSKFLKSWKSIYKIPFPVLGTSLKTMGEIFSAPYYIPADAIVDGDRVLKFKEVGASTKTLFKKIDDLLKEKKSS